MSGGVPRKRIFRSKRNQGPRASSLRMPAVGVYNESGILFHHVVADHTKLKEEHIVRLKECGIRNETGAFNAAEDAIIRRNWTEFAKEYEIPFEDAKQIMAPRGTKYMEHHSLISLWPRMCRDLPQRTATQVSHRMRKLLDPAVLNGSDVVTYNVKNPIKGDELHLLFKLYKQFRDWSKVAEKLGRTRLKCVDTYVYCLRRRVSTTLKEGDFSPQMELRRLWENVISRTVISISADEEIPPETFRQIVKRAIQTNKLDALEAKMHDLEYDVPFLDISIDLTSVKTWCENDWKSILERLQSNFNKLVEEGRSEEDAWLGCFREVLGDPGHITLTAYCKFLHHLADATPSNILLGCLRSKYYDLDKLSDQLKLDDVCEFLSDNMSEVEYLISKTQTILSRSQMLLFNRLKRRYSLKDRLLVLSSAFSRQLQQHGQPLPQVDIEVFNGRIQEQATVVNWS